MQLKSLFLSFLLILLTACATNSSKNFGCDFNSVYLKGVADGEEGLNFSKSLEEMCTHQDKNFNKETYLNGQKVGLQNFCTFKRGQQRALMKLDPESMCSVYINYNEGFDLTVKNHCSKELAERDAESLTPSNLNCLEDNGYKKHFYKVVSRVCNKKMVYQQGSKNTPLSDYCLNLDNKNELEISYNLGLQNYYKLEAMHLEKKAQKLSSKLKVLKRIVPKDESQKTSINKRIDKLSKDFLETKHTLEQKKSKL